MKALKIALAAAVTLSASAAAFAADARPWHGHHRHCTASWHHHHRVTRCW